MSKCIRLDFDVAGKVNMFSVMGNKVYFWATIERIEVNVTGNSLFRFETMNERSRIQTTLLFEKLSEESEVTQEIVAMDETLSLDRCLVIWTIWWMPLYDFDWQVETPVENQEMSVQKTYRFAVASESVLSEEMVESIEQVETKRC